MIGKIVKVYLSNGTGIEGKLAELNNKRLTLYSIESDGELMILNPYKNVVMIKTVNLSENNISSNHSSDKKDIEEDIEEDIEDEEDNEKNISPLVLRAKNIAELKALEAKVEAEQITAALKKQERLENTKQNYEDRYGEIDCTKLGTQKLTTKKSGGYDGKNASRLPDVFFKQRK